jgi:hypothetical protein
VLPDLEEDLDRERAAIVSDESRNIGVGLALVPGQHEHLLQPSKKALKHIEQTKHELCRKFIRWIENIYILVDGVGVLLEEHGINKVNFL